MNKQDFFQYSSGIHVMHIYWNLCDNVDDIEKYRGNSHIYLSWAIL